MNNEIQFCRHRWLCWPAMLEIQSKNGLKQVPEVGLPVTVPAGVSCLALITCRQTVVVNETRRREPTSHRSDCFRPENYMTQIRLLQTRDVNPGPPKHYITQTRLLQTRELSQKAAKYQQQPRITVWHNKSIFTIRYHTAVTGKYYYNMQIFKVCSKSWQVASLV